MATVAPPKYVAAPSVTASRFGLLSAADLIQITDPHERNGVEWQSPPAGPAKYTPYQCNPGSADPISVEDGLPVTQASPITVYNGFTCRAVGLSEGEMLDHARAALAGGEQTALEHVLWGDADIDLKLMEDGETDLLADDPVSLVAGLGLLEKHLNDSGVGVGVIHSPREYAPLFAAEHQLESEAGRKVTVLGTRLSFGSYPGTGPDGTAPAAGTGWLVATGPVVVRRTEVVHRPDSYASSFDRSNNEIFHIAERTFVVAWDDRVRAAVPVTL
ncbi:hypothetical protein [Rhodococcoides kyotonense]|uniref:Phage major capsid protein n=1 Tax=Rhodococcoides kyotonense TaxID=398843 RepID=A0A239FPT2_9NOCA|nr:hypothetical protein [Rhodococcus kyotonensis]SNS58628.1 hypothetical protein SAMN05421642_103392 [Rhodococcus kyotonensis]